MRVILRDLFGTPLTLARSVCGTSTWYELARSVCGTSTCGTDVTGPHVTRDTHVGLAARLVVLILPCPSTRLALEGAAVVKRRWKVGVVLSSFVG